MNAERLMMEWMRNLSERANYGNSLQLEDNKHLILAVLRDFANLRVKESVEGRVNESDIEFAITGLDCIEKTVDRKLRDSVTLVLKDSNRISGSLLEHWL
ncbi:MAG: hypothetical protein ACYTDT_01450 [Planctomycetota bacterium]|jgi:hypothetical protein